MLKTTKKQSVNKHLHKTLRIRGSPQPLALVAPILIFTMRKRELDNKNEELESLITRRSKQLLCIDQAAPLPRHVGQLLCIDLLH